MLMAHVIKTSVFLILLLLCLAAVTSGSTSTSTEHNVITTLNESSDDKPDNANINKELKKEMTKYQRGRKMGGFEVKKDSTETGVNLSIGKSVNGMKRDLSTFKGASGKAIVVGFVPLSSDYRQPRSHKPVHN